MTGGADGPRLPLDEPAAGGAAAIGPGAWVLRGFLGARASDILGEIERMAKISPFRHMATPGGKAIGAAMTNCGDFGWVSDRRGYGYAALDPLTGAAWPKMPALLRDLAVGAAEAAGFHAFAPDACLINAYAPGTKMALHQDRDERDFDAPIVSFSLGLPVVFLWGGMARRDRPARVVLRHGDVLAWGGADRLRFHGVDVLKPGDHPLLGARRINLTFRRAR